MLAALVISVFTLPFAYAATVVVGWPAFFLLGRLGRLSVGYAVGVGALAGLVVIVVLRQWLHPGFETITAFVAAVGGCIVSGVLSAVLFYRIIATSPEPPDSALERTSGRRAGRLSCTSIERAEAAQL